MLSRLTKKTPPVSEHLAGFQNTQDNEAKLVVDEQGTIVFASAAFLGLANLNRETIAAHDFDSIFNFQTEASHDLKTMREGVYPAIINGAEHPYDFHVSWLQMPDRRRFLVANYNKSMAFTQTASEITQPSTQTRHKHHDDIDLLLNLSREIMVVLDSSGEILRANARFAKILGYNAADLNTLNFFDIISQDDRSDMHAKLQTITDNNTATINTAAINYEARIVPRDSAPLWIEWRCQSLNGLTYCTGQDVTSIKAQKTALEQREKQLSEAESIARMGHWHWVLGEEHLQWSPEIYNIFGVENGSFEPTLDAMNLMVHADDIDRVNQALQRAIIEENDYDVEFCIIRPDGEERYIRSEGRCSRDTDGDVNALFGIMQDMTERMLYERELKSAKDAAERAYAAKTQFLANMSHELRTPLNAIIGFSEMIERQLLGPVGNEKYLDYIGGIRESGVHLLDLISDILIMSKIEAGKYDLAFETLNVLKIMQLASHMMEGRALEAGVKITTHTPYSHNNEQTQDELNAINIVADRRGILQIMLNLLSNAIKFSNQNDQISLSCLVHSDGITLTIQDNGIGIPANKLATITNPFEQVSSSYARDHEGSGLGLSITKELAELHNGHLQIESEVGVGTTVSVSLPFEPEACHEASDT